MPTFRQSFRNFSGGNLEDKRLSSPTHYSLTKHFDAFTFGTKLVPYFKTIASLGVGAGNIKDLMLMKFLYAPISSTLYRLFGYGVDSATGFTKLYAFDIDNGTPNTSNWVAATNGGSGVAGRDTNAFFYYKGFIYNFTQGTTLQRADATGVAAFTDNYQSIAYTKAVQPVLHPSDDIAYFFGKNTVYALNGTSWQGLVLTLPSNMTITSACADGNYLSIGLVTDGNADIRSIVYRWDRDSSLTTLTDRIKFGEGALVHLENLDGRLIGVMNYYLDNLYGLQMGKCIVKWGNGELATPLSEILTDASVADAMPSTHVVRDNKIYFPMKATLRGDTRLGIWVVNSAGKITLDTVEEQAISYQGIYSIGNLWWIAHSADGSVSHTDGSLGYSSTLASIYESLILNTVHVTSRGVAIGDSSIQKKLQGVTITTEALPSGGQVVMKYRKDGSTSWTTILTRTDVGSMSFNAVNIDSDHSALPSYKEIEFRIESTGGAVITGFEYSAEAFNTTPFE